MEKEERKMRGSTQKTKEEKSHTQYIVGWDVLELTCNYITNLLIMNTQVNTSLYPELGYY